MSKVHSEKNNCRVSLRADWLISTAKTREHTTDKSLTCFKRKAIEVSFLSLCLVVYIDFRRVELVQNNSDNVKMHLGRQSVKKKSSIPIVNYTLANVTIKRKKDEIDNRDDI